MPVPDNAAVAADSTEPEFRELLHSQPSAPRNFVRRRSAVIQHLHPDSRRLIHHQDGNFRRKIPRGVAFEVADHEVLHPVFTVDHRLAFARRAPPGPEAVEFDVLDAADPLREILVPEKRRPAVARPVHVDREAAAPRDDVFEAEIADRRGVTQHPDHRVAVFGVEVPEDDVLDRPADHAGVFETAHRVVGVERDEVVVGFAFGDRADVLDDAVFDPAVEMEPVLVVLDGVALEADVADFEAFEHTHADKVDHAVCHGEVGKFEVPDIAEVERGPGAGLEVEEIGVLEVGAPALVAVPHAAGDMDGGVAELVVGVGEQEVVGSVPGLAADEKPRAGIGDDGGEGVDPERPRDAVGPRRDEHLFAPAVEHRLNRRGIVGDAVADGAALPDIVSHPESLAGLRLKRFPV